jgi:hypothetical protein
MHIRKEGAQSRQKRKELIQRRNKPAKSPKRVKKTLFSGTHVTLN